METRAPTPEVPAGEVTYGGHPANIEYFLRGKLCAIFIFAILGHDVKCAKIDIAQSMKQIFCTNRIKSMGANF